MKISELKVRDKISETLIILVEIKMKEIDYNEWKGLLGEIWVEAKQVGENTIINCYCCDCHFIRLVISKSEVIQFKVSPVGQGLLQLRWFLEQIKKR